MGGGKGLRCGRGGGRGIRGRFVRGEKTGVGEGGREVIEEESKER